jgi:hypothetical protein
VTYRGQDLSEWGIVELQGQLETKDGLKFDDLHIGDLHFDETVRLCKAKCADDVKASQSRA